MCVLCICLLYVCCMYVLCVVCVCVCELFIMHTLYISHENILRVNATKYFQVDGHKVQRNSNLVVIVQETIVLREPPLKALDYVLNFYTEGDVYLIHFQTFLLSFC